MENLEALKQLQDCSTKWDYMEKVTSGKTEMLYKAISWGLPVHFYGTGLGKSTLCLALREAGAKNISEAGEIEGDFGCWGIPENFTGLLICFNRSEIPENPPTLKELTEALSMWL